MATALGTTESRPLIGDAASHRWLGVFLLMVSLIGGAHAWADDQERHPLDPLNREEIAAVVEILTNAGKVGPGTRFALNSSKRRAIAARRRQAFKGETPKSLMALQGHLGINCAIIKMGASNHARHH